MRSGYRSYRVTNVTKVTELQSQQSNRVTEVTEVTELQNIRGRLTPSTDRKKRQATIHVMAASGGKDILVASPPQISRDKILSDFPLHWHVWHKDAASLEEELALNKHNKEVVDPRGRTPLHLAVSLGYVDCVQCLLSGGCDANAINKDGWNVSHEAVSTGNPEILSLVLQHRDFQRGSQRLGGIPELLDELNAAPDFYVEMRWEFTSWVPFMSRMCPSDTYKIYKCGANVRADTTLIGFDQSDWQRGNRSYVFKGGVDGGEFLEIDHDKKRFFRETLRIREDFRDLEAVKPSDDVVNTRLTSPAVATMLNTDNIAFTRHKTMWGWGGDKTEIINGFECKVYTASGVEVLTKTRVEHLNAEDKQAAQNTNDTFAANGFQTLLGIEEENFSANFEDDQNRCVIDPTSSNPYNMTIEEYFSPSSEPNGKDIGKLKEMTVKKQKFKATISMADKHPLSLGEQVLPIIKLLAISNTHFAKLRDFIALHLPAGFPVKIEIPLFHVLNAKVTFGNIGGTESSVNGVHAVKADIQELDEEGEVAQQEADLLSLDQSAHCVIETTCFEAPAGYREVNLDQPVVAPVGDEEDELLQLAIRQSLLEYQQDPANLASLQALRDSQQNEDQALQRAIQESMKETGNTGTEDDAENPTENRQEGDGAVMDDEDLQLAMALSEQQLEEDERLRKQEFEELEKIARQDYQ
ncbi:ankyrin repeat domain-containing protein 13D-like isoform X3 [Montipora capricornis]|uniref:ankyrin repeat domain-containing protein 13D-like isoform X3 n=1 Tax=Montipora capricornis TaxID=246305 RepID=UPI0035F1C69D